MNILTNNPSKMIFNLSRKVNLYFRTSFDYLYVFFSEVIDPEFTFLSFKLQVSNILNLSGIKITKFIQSIPSAVHFLGVEVSGEI
jgi:hypothetical protein